jgi:hypothetical protein
MEDSVFLLEELVAKGTKKDSKHIQHIFFNPDEDVGLF